MADLLNYPRYFLHKGWTHLKLTVAGLLTLLSGGAILYGVIASATFSIVYGSLGTVGGIIIFATTRKESADTQLAVAQYDALVKQHERQLKEVEEKLQEFDIQNSQFSVENQNLKENAKKLNATLKLSMKKLFKMEELKNEYEENASLLAKNLKENQGQIQTLESNVDELIEAKNQYVAENMQLQQSLKDAQTNLSNIEALYASARSMNASRGKQLKKMKTIVESMQNVLLAVADEGDKCQSFADTIDKNLIRLDQQTQRMDHTASIMDVLLNKLKTSTFGTLDSNHDGIVTEHEFSENIERLGE